MWRQWEQSKDSSEGYFKFEWMLDLTLDYETLQCSGASVKVMNYEFGEETAELWKNKVQSLLKEVMPEGR